MTKAISRRKKTEPDSPEQLEHENKQFRKCFSAIQEALYGWQVWSPDAVKLLELIKQEMSGITL